MAKKVIGTYEGISADADITNNNGLDITRDVWKGVFDSEDYAIGIKNKWFIGFLGHPEDPDCMDFEHGCIVMTEGHLGDDGKVYAKFDLLDTPVGRIVKVYIDAGVKFGISVRGAGDISNNSVDPDTFVFRGFDLVIFPAYDEAVPEFQAIAASTDVESRAKYKKVCSAIDKNLSNITSSSAIEVLQSPLAPQSKEYSKLETRKSEILEHSVLNLDLEKIEGLTQLYLDAISANKALANELESAKQKLGSEKISARRKISSIERILCGQVEVVSNEKDRSILAYNKLNKQYKVLLTAKSKLDSQIRAAQESNLIYKQKIEAHSEDMCEKDKIISSLQSDLNETVTAGTKIKTRASNLDGKVKTLKADIQACNRLITSYQTAYAEMYANALGINLGSLPITSSTTVAELQNLVSGATNTSNISTVFVQPLPVDLSDDDEDNEIVTI